MPLVPLPMALTQWLGLVGEVTLNCPLELDYRHARFPRIALAMAIKYALSSFLLLLCVGSFFTLHLA